MCSSADPSRKTGILFSNRTVIPTGGIMGLWPTQGDEKHLDPASTLNGAVTLSLSSRPERSAAEGPAVPQTFRGNVFRQSEAERIDLRFLLILTQTLGPVPTAMVVGRCSWSFRPQTRTE